jgi:hypothetical protein
MTLLDAYQHIFSRLQMLRPTERNTEPPLLLASVLAYLMHGIVQRPDEMSSSRYMIKQLEIVSRARRFGFASVPTDRLSDDLLGMRSTLAFAEYKILDYTARKNPAGARLKSSRLPQNEPRATLGSASASRSNASATQNFTPGSIHADYDWVVPLVNETLAGWLWGRMAEGDKARSASTAVFRGPFLLSRWEQCVDTGVQRGIRRSPHGFTKAQKYFSPPNWVLSNAGTVWLTLTEVFFSQITQRLEGLDYEQRATYSSGVRSAIARTLRTWEFLPCVHKDTVWSTTGSGRTKAYMIYRNPSFRSGV